MINNMAADLQLTAADLRMQEEQNTRMICDQQKLVLLRKALYKESTCPKAKGIYPMSHIQMNY